MVNPTSFIPTIGGFSPFPVAIMIPFMEAQSQQLARAFGLNYEIGKRTIKSMSNEQFNALTEEDITKMLRASATEATARLIDSLPQVATLQKYIIQEYKDVELKKVDANIQLIKDLVANLPSMATDNKLLENIIRNMMGIPLDFNTTSSNKPDDYGTNHGIEDVPSETKEDTKITDNPTVKTPEPVKEIVKTNLVQKKSSGEYITREQFYAEWKGYYGLVNRAYQDLKKYKSRGTRIDKTALKYYEDRLKTSQKQLEGFLTSFKNWGFNKPA